VRKCENEIPRKVPDRLDIRSLHANTTHVTCIGKLPVSNRVSAGESIAKVLVRGYLECCESVT
jgi:hypothetical protein